MDENKWVQKSFALLKSMQDDYGVLFFSNYLCFMEGDSVDNSVFVIELLDIKKTLGRVIDLINVETKEDFLQLKSELESIKDLNIKISELEFRHRIKSIATKINTLDERERPMVAYEIRVDDYNAIRLCELCDGRFYYEKHTGTEKAHGKTKFLFNQNMSYEIAFVNNMQQLHKGNNGYRDKNYTNNNEVVVEEKIKAIENLFVEKKEDICKEEKEVVININKKSFVEKPREIKIQIDNDYEDIDSSGDIPFEDYLKLKVLKYMYGSHWTTDVALARLKEEDFLKEFKENNPEVFDEIFKTMLIEVRGYVKLLGRK